MRNRLILVSLSTAAVVAGGILWWQSGKGAPRGAAAYAHTVAILDFGPRPAGSAELDAVRSYIATQLAALGWATQAQPFERSTAFGTVKFENLIARFPAGPWERPVKAVLCAHVDSKLFKDRVFLGADDAASACGAVLEIAAILANEDPELARQVELVFFDGEEAFGPEGITPFDGLFGSRYYARQWQTQPYKPAFGILLDMIGHKNLKIDLPSDTPEALRDAVLAAAKAERASAHFGIAPGPFLDDHVPMNMVGIPTVDLIGKFALGYEPSGKPIYAAWWHTTGDTLELISPESLDISVRVTLRFLREKLGK